MIAFVVNVPWSVWFTPIVQNVISRSWAARMRAAMSRSALSIPQSAATRSGG
jgi:hypothetical protein